MATELDGATAHAFAMGMSDLMDALRESGAPRREDFSEDDWRLVELAQLLNSRVAAAPAMSEACGPNVVDARGRFRDRRRGASGVRSRNGAT